MDKKRYMEFTIKEDTKKNYDKFGEIKDNYRDSINKHITPQNILSGTSTILRIGKWLEDSKNIVSDAHCYRYNNYEISKSCPICKENDENITLIQQYYIDKDKDRSNEIKRCLNFNVNNNSITKIILLNERIYTEDELGVKSNKIEQVVINSRLTYLKAFEYAKKNLSGYIVLSNTDIFFDKTIKNVNCADLTGGKKGIFCQLRYEFINPFILSECLTNSLRPDSQDAWIWHSSLDLPKNANKILDMNLGEAGCDNKLIYLLSLLGLECYNEPERIRCYHYHITGVRNYDASNPVSNPLYTIFPQIKNGFVCRNSENFNPSDENGLLGYIISKSINNKKKFIIPRIAGIENNIALLGVQLEKNSNKLSEDMLINLKKVMKNNAGIRLDDIDSIKLYSHIYLSAFQKCDNYLWWCPYGNVVASIVDSFNFIVSNFHQEKIDAVSALDVFHNINRKFSFI